MHALAIPKNELVSFEKLLLEIGSEAAATNPYEHARYKIDNLTVIVYKSGKAVFSDMPMGEPKEAILKYLESIDPFDCPIIGSDEAGKGEAVGPLVAGAVLLSTKRERAEARFGGAMDSKEMSNVQLGRVYEHIKSYAHAVRLLSPSDFNARFKNNLNEILCEMHTSAISVLLHKLDGQECRVIIDKFGGKVHDAFLKEQIKSINPNADVTIITKAEQFTPVACASVISKHEYERWLDSYAEKHNIDVRGLAREEMLKSKNSIAEFAKLTYIK